MHWNMQKSQIIHTLSQCPAFPIICYFPDFMAFGLQENFEYHVAQWSWPELISDNSYTGYFVNLNENKFKSYT